MFTNRPSNWRPRMRDRQRTARSRFVLRLGAFSTKGSGLRLHCHATPSQRRGHCPLGKIRERALTGKTTVTERVSARQNELVPLQAAKWWVTPRRQCANMPPPNLCHPLLGWSAAGSQHSASTRHRGPHHCPLYHVCFLRRRVRAVSVGHHPVSLRAAMAVRPYRYGPRDTHTHGHTQHYVSRASARQSRTCMVCALGAQLCILRGPSRLSIMCRQPFSCSMSFRVVAANAATSPSSMCSPVLRRGKCIANVRDFCPDSWLVMRVRIYLNLPWRAPTHKRSGDLLPPRTSEALQAHGPEGPPTRNTAESQRAGRESVALGSSPLKACAKRARAGEIRAAQIWQPRRPSPWLSGGTSG